MTLDLLEALLVLFSSLLGHLGDRKLDEGKPGCSSVVVLDKDNLPHEDMIHPFRTRQNHMQMM